MPKEPIKLEDDDIVIIKQRDKKGQLYIAIAAIIGVALGGLIGSWSSSEHWKEQYQALEQQQSSLKEQNQQIVQGLQTKSSQLEQKLSSEAKAALSTQEVKLKQSTLEFEAKIHEITANNQKLTAELAAEKSKNAALTSKTRDLSERNNLQTTMFEQAKGLFTKEAAVKQKLDTLSDEKTELNKTILSLKKECDLFLQGTSWDAKSDACDKQDAANSRLSEVNQMIKVNTLDLKQIQTLNSKLGM